MSKKVFVLSGSPRRKGNSDLLCDEFIGGAKESGHRVEKVFFREKKIAYCSGCGFCFKEKKCSIQDDMTEILAQMKEADVIVFATPIYFYAMDGQMKTLIDRTCPGYEELNNKEFYFIMTAADNDSTAMDVAIAEFRGFTSCLNNPIEKGILSATGVWNIGDVTATKHLNTAYKMGKEI